MGQTQNTPAIKPGGTRKTTMHNVTHEVRGDKLVITIDIGAQAIQAAPPSSSGKTYLVGTTGGTVSVPTKHASALTFAINVMAKR
jgi:hypothetical protein